MNDRRVSRPVRGPAAAFGQALLQVPVAVRVLRELTTPLPAWRQVMLVVVLADAALAAVEAVASSA